jgi:hypothetical protein
VRTRVTELAKSAIAGGEQVLFAEFGTLARYGSLDESQPMTRVFERAPVPEYALLSGNALIVATEQRLLVATEDDDSSPEVHLAVSYPQITAIARPDTGWSARIRGWFSRNRLVGSAVPNIADVNPPFEIRGENEAVALQLRPSYAKQLLGVLLQHSDAPVLPSPAG